MISLTVLVSPLLYFLLCTPSFEANFTAYGTFYFESAPLSCQTFPFLPFFPPFPIWRCSCTPGRYQDCTDPRKKPQAHGHFALLFWNSHTRPHALRASCTPVATGQFFTCCKCVSLTPSSAERMRHNVRKVAMAHCWMCWCFLSDRTAVNTVVTVCLPVCDLLRTCRSKWRLHWLRQPRPPRLNRLTTLVCACRQC